MQTGWGAPRTLVRKKLKERREWMLHRSQALSPEASLRFMQLCSEAGRAIMRDAHGCNLHCISKHARLQAMITHVACSHAAHTDVADGDGLKVHAAA
jgi:hypothetical protein